MLRFLVREIYSNVGTKVVARATQNRLRGIIQNLTCRETTLPLSSCERASKTSKTNVGTTWARSGRRCDRMEWVLLFFRRVYGRRQSRGRTRAHAGVGACAKATSLAAGPRKVSNSTRSKL